MLNCLDLMYLGSYSVKSGFLIDRKNLARIESSSEGGINSAFLLSLSFSDIQLWRRLTSLAVLRFVLRFFMSSTNVCDLSIDISRKRDFFLPFGHLDLAFYLKAFPIPFRPGCVHFDRRMFTSREAGCLAMTDSLLFFARGKSIFMVKTRSTVYSRVITSVRLKYMVFRLSARAGKNWLSGAVRVTFGMLHCYRICNSVVIGVNIETSM